jgi:DNA-binding transcriptional LysR family regulator
MRGMTTAIMMVEAGLGVAVLPAYVWGFARVFNVVSKVLCDPEVRREVAIIQASDRSLSPAAEAFLAYLGKCAQRRPAPGGCARAAAECQGAHL